MADLETGLRGSHQAKPVLGDKDEQMAVDAPCDRAMLKPGGRHHH